MLGIDARTDDLKIKLIQDINAANMPACILYYVLADLLADVRSQLDSEIQRERTEYQKELEGKDESVKASLQTDKQHPQRG